MSDVVTPEEFAVLAGRVAALDGRGPVVVPPTPAALERARIAGVDVSQVTGTGPAGQVTEDDVAKADAKQKADIRAAEAPAEPAPAQNVSPVDTPPATPAAVAHAEELGVPLDQVEGTGAGGTITKADVAAAAPGEPGGA